MKRRLAVAAIAWAVVGRAEADCRLILADQSDYSSNLGFYVDLEATTASDGLCHLDTLTMYTGVADGTAWRFPSFVPASGWQYGYTYNVVVTIAPATTTMQVNGATVAQSPGAFTPYSGEITVNEIPSWAASNAAFSVIEGDFQISNSSGTAQFLDQTAGVPADVLALSGPLTETLQFTSSASDTQVIQTSFTLQPSPFAGQPVPLVDRYGQSVQSTWTGKVSSDNDLAADDAAEQVWLAKHPPTQNADRWGGITNAGWSQQGTGYYTVAKRNGYWWLISPQGNPVFYTGLCGPPALNWDVTPITGREWEFATVPPDSGATAAGWSYDPWGVGDNTYYFAFITANLISKFGANWQDLSTARSAVRLPSWGFTGLGKWSSPVGALPNLPVLYVNSPVLSTGHIDPFDTTMTTAFQIALAAQIQSYPGDSSTILGWSWTNEIQGIVLASEAQSILQLGATVPAKQAMIDYGVTHLYGGSVAAAAAAWGVQATTLAQLYATSPTPPAADLEAMREYYENAVHRFVYASFKTVDPHHLYFGFWIVPEWWADPSDWLIAAANCDVLGYDRYAFNLMTDDLKVLLALVDKPTLIGEFSFPPTYNLVRGFGVYPSANAEDDAAAGRAYQQWVQEAAREPTTVGTMWFQYRDEPIAGRGPCPTGQPDTIVCGEHYAFGAADVTDRPKYDLVIRMREANLCAGPLRLSLTDPLVRPSRYGSGDISGRSPDRDCDTVLPRE
ncbi:MAG: hypothetical protein ABSF98_07310 [Bryobacteraceae bacterium]